MFYLDPFDLGNKISQEEDDYDNVDISNVGGTMHPPESANGETIFYDLDDDDVIKTNVPMRRCCYVCPVADCEWEGESSSVLNHFRETHQDLVVASNIIKTDISQDNVLNRLMVSDDEIFLVQTTFRANEAKLGICLRYLGSPERAAGIRYSLEVDGNSNFGSYGRSAKDHHGQEPFIKIINGKIEIEVDRITLAQDFLHFAVMVGPILPEMGPLPNNIIEQNHSKEIPTIDELEEIEDDFEHITLTDGISDSSRDLQSQRPHLQLSTEMTEEEMLEMLTCVICRHQIYPPVYSCENGHSLCHNCIECMCDICGEDGGEPRRNSQLEDMSAQITYPCKYSNCKERFKLNLLQQHEMVCTKVLYTCPVCLYSKYQGTVSEMQKHFKIKHPSVKVFTTLMMDLAKGNDGVIVTDKGIFYGNCVAHNAVVTWKIVFCGPAERAANFTCEVSLREKRKKSKSSISGKVVPLEAHGKEYTLEMKQDDLKKRNLQDKNVTVVIHDKH